MLHPPQYPFSKHSLWSHPLLGSEYTKENTTVSALLVLRVELEETVKMRKQTTYWVGQKVPSGFLYSMMGKPRLLVVWDLPASGGGTGSILTRKDSRCHGQPSAWAEMTEQCLQMCWPPVQMFSSTATGGSSPHSRHLDQDHTQQQRASARIKEQRLKTMDQTVH